MWRCGGRRGGGGEVTVLMIVIMMIMIKKIVVLVVNVLIMVVTLISLANTDKNSSSICKKNRIDKFLLFAYNFTLALRSILMPIFPPVIGKRSILCFCPISRKAYLNLLET